MNELMGEAEVVIGDDTYRLVMNNAAWVAIEGVLDDSYIDIIAGMVQREIAGKAPKNSVTGALLYGATRAHHSYLTPGQCGDLMMRHMSAFNEPLGRAIRMSIKLKDDPEPGEAEPPTAAVKANGTGSRPSKATSKQAEQPQVSG